MNNEHKLHKINLTLETKEEWLSRDVAEQVQELLVMDNEDGGPFTSINTKPDPANEDVPLQEAVEELISLLKLYSGIFKVKIKHNRALKMFAEGVEKIEHGVIDLKACLRCVRSFASDTPEIQVAKVGFAELMEAPHEVVHAVAHTMGLDKDECENMTKEDMIDWIRETVKGPPDAIN